MCSAAQNILMSVAAAWGAISSLQAAPLAPGDGPREIGRTTEKEVTVVLSSSFGSVYISRGEPEKILIADGVHRRQDDPGIKLEYSIRNRIGYMDLALGEESEGHERKKGAFLVKDFKGGKWYLRYSPAIPISFDVELGVGNGDFDLTGLKVKDFNLSTGASDVTLAFDEPNKATIDNLNIESGVSKFNGRNLGNANFKRFRFQGGVGTYTLDFSGQLNREVDVDVEVGLGAVTIIVPENVGAKIYYEESWVSRIDCDRDFQSAQENQYITDNFQTASGRMNLRIQAGLGSVKVRRR